MFFRRFKATGTVHCVPHCSFATTCALPVLLCMYVPRIYGRRCIVRSLPTRGSLVLVQCQPAGERAVKTIPRRLFSISISLRMESPAGEVSFNAVWELARFRIRLGNLISRYKHLTYDASVLINARIPRRVCLCICLKNILPAYRDMSDMLKIIAINCRRFYWNKWLSAVFVLKTARKFKSWIIELIIISRYFYVAFKREKEREQRTRAQK